MLRITPVGLLVCAMVPVACDGGAAPHRYHLDSLPTLTATVEQKLGNVNDPDLGFSRIAAVDVDRDGNVYVLEATERQIRVYSPDLRISRRIGRAGEGPGEFQGTPWFGVLGDTVWAIDGIPGTITLFSRDGAVLSTGKTAGLRVPLPGTSYGTISPVSMRPDGRFTAEFNMISGGRDNPVSGVKETDAIPVPRVIFDATGAVVDTVGFDDKPPPRMWRAPGTYAEGGFQVVRINDTPFLVPDPPTEMPVWFALHEGRIVVNTPQPASDTDNSFTITRLSLKRDTVYHRAFRYTPVRYESAELDSIALRASFGMTSSRSSGARQADPAVAARLRAEMKFPDLKMPIGGSWVAQDESIWLRRADLRGASSRWILVDADGQPEGQLELSPRLRVLWRTGDVFWGSELDDLDVPWLVKYRISSTR